MKINGCRKRKHTNGENFIDTNIYTYTHISIRQMLLCNWAPFKWTGHLHVVLNARKGLPTIFTALVFLVMNFVSIFDFSISFDFSM